MFEVRPGPQPGAIYRNEKGDNWKVVGVAWNEEELSWDLLKVTSSARSEKQSGEQQQQQQHEEAKMTL